MNDAALTVASPAETSTVGSVSSFHVETAGAWMATQTNELSGMTPGAVSVIVMSLIAWPVRVVDSVIGDVDTGASVMYAFVAFVTTGAPVDAVLSPAGAVRSRGPGATAAPVSYATPV